MPRPGGAFFYTACSGWAFCPESAIACFGQRGLHLFAPHLLPQQRGSRA